MGGSIYLALMVVLVAVSAACTESEVEKEYREVKSKVFQHDIGPIYRKHYDMLEVQNGLRRLNKIKTDPALEKLIEIGEVSEDRCSPDEFYPIFEDLKSNVTFDDVQVYDQAGSRQYMIDCAIKQFKLCEGKYHSDLVNALEQLSKDEQNKLDKIGTIFDDLARSSIHNPIYNVEYHTEIVEHRLNKVFNSEKDLLKRMKVWDGEARKKKQSSTLLDFCKRVTQCCASAAKPYWKLFVYVDPEEKLIDDFARKWSMKIKACNRVAAVLWGTPIPKFTKE